MKDAISHALYPKVTDEYLQFRKEFGPVDKIDTLHFLGIAKIEQFSKIIKPTLISVIKF